MNRLILWILFVVLSLVNAWILVHRDRFQYTGYGTDHFLYGTAATPFTDASTVFSPAEIAGAKKLTATAVPRDVSTIARLEAISFFLLSRFHDQRGVPNPDSLNRAAVLDVYNALLASKENKIWCGQFGTMMLLFAAAHNIRGRVVEVFNPGNHHVFNEFYIPEWRQWIMMDVYSNLVFARSRSGVYLNAQSFRKAVNSANPVRVTSLVSGRLADTILDKQAAAVRNYHTRALPYYYYKTTNLAKAYSPRARFKRYLLPDPWYYIYREDGGSNTLHWLKLCFLAGWLLVTILIAGSYIKRTS